MGGANMGVLYMGVSKILAMDGGVLSCGGDGTVKLFRLTPMAFDLAGATSSSALGDSGVTSVLF
jgi:hypothetical protein